MALFQADDYYSAGTRIEPVDTIKIDRAEGGAARGVRSVRTTPYRFRIVYNYRPWTFVEDVFAFFNANSDNWFDFTRQNGKTYTCKFVGTPQVTEARGRDKYKVTINLIGRRKTIAEHNLIVPGFSYGYTIPQLTLVGAPIDLVIANPVFDYSIPEIPLAIEWQFERFMHNSAALGYATEMCILRPMRGGERYPVRSCIFSLHGANGTVNTSFNHANRIRGYIEQAVTEGIIEPCCFVFPSNGRQPETPPSWWQQGPVRTMLETEIFPDEPVGYTPVGVIHKGLHGNSLGGGNQVIFNETPEFTSSTTTSGVNTRDYLTSTCLNLGRVWMGHHFLDETNVITTQQIDNWNANACGRAQQTSDIITDPAFCGGDYHNENCMHGALYPIIWKTHQDAINDAAAAL